MGEVTTQPGWATALASLLLAFVIAAGGAAAAGLLVRRPPETKTLATKRQLTLRIEDIPVSTTVEQLQCDLESIVERELGLKEDAVTVVYHHLVRRNHEWACATATFSTSLPEDRLVQKLGQARDSHSYRFYAKVDGITPLYEDPKGAHVDVVAVPGLGSHAIGSWKSPKSNDVWLRDYLPGDLPNVRVLLYGYDTTLVNSNSRDSIETLGHRFLESIKEFRKSSNTDRRPVVFLGHSLGGLLIKEALVYASSRPDDPNVNIYKACYGLLFFGVPNLGLRNEQLNSIVQGQPNEAFVRSLVVDDDSEPSSFLNRIAAEFSRCCQGKYKVVSFFETRKSRTVQLQPDGKTLTKTGPETLMVTQKSATSTGLTAVADEDNIPLSADHMGLVKYEGRTNNEYRTVIGRLKTVVEEAKEEVPKRFLEIRT
ncbi:hypothetical protein B0T24DRAFT_579256 [Lasiosphaeria ovina]|uniref:DUF676 domain-containing protein n=1 Tax=Lasiosphaeria ovina TaxID=92902 RepID=A0AAE0N705_9PEZI|nr:hypothetical protein B0T24DRAFT_579256 [Lasiosphaeria ovina]